jgi:hypothetical protein
MCTPVHIGQDRSGQTGIDRDLAIWFNGIWFDNLNCRPGLAALATRAARDSGRGARTMSTTTTTGIESFQSDEARKMSDQAKQATKRPFAKKAKVKAKSPKNPAKKAAAVKIRNIARSLRNGKYPKGWGLNPNKVARKVQVLGRTVERTAGNNHIDDGCEAMARASDGVVRTLQVRMLRAMVKARGPVTRLDLKEATNHWPTRTGYHKDWVAALNDLCPKFAKVRRQDAQEGEGPAKFTYTIAAAGSQLLDKLSKAAR